MATEITLCPKCGFNVDADDLERMFKKKDTVTK